MQVLGMMRKLGLAAVLAVLPLTGQATTLVLEDLGYERDVIVADTDAATVGVFLNAALLQLFANDPFGELSVESDDLSKLTEAFFALLGPGLDDELSKQGAALFGSDDATGLAQFLFEGVFGDGVYEPFNGGAVLVEVKAPGLVPFADDFLTDQGTITFTVLKDFGVIPLPAGLPLMLAGLGALAVLRRRQKA